MKIVISGDIQRGNQESNIRTLHSLIAPAITRITGSFPEIIPKGRVLSQADWVKALETSAYLLDDIKGEPIFLIGFELPIGLIQECLKRGIPFLDVSAHPIRFCDDLFFGVRSQADLSRFFISKEEIDFSATVMKARSHNQAGIRLGSNVLLVIGQTEFDRAVVLNGKAHQLSDFEAQIIELIKDGGYDEVVWKPHPANKNGIHRRFINSVVHASRVKSSQLTEVNIYKLLSEPSIKTVVSVSSSVLAEAKFFDKTVHRLLQKDVSEGYGPVSVEAISSELFWYLALKEHVHVNLPVAYTPSRLTNRLRNIFGSGWGYPFFKP